jgi:hypothetical protein
LMDNLRFTEYDLTTKIPAITEHFGWFQKSPYCLLRRRGQYFSA